MLFSAVHDYLISNRLFSAVHDYLISDRLFSVVHVIRQDTILCPIFILRRSMSKRKRKSRQFLEYRSLVIFKFTFYTLLQKFMLSLVHFKVRNLITGKRTVFALVWFFSCVDPHVSFQIRTLYKTFWAHRTAERFHASVIHHVPSQFVFISIRFSAQHTHERCRREVFQLFWLYVLWEAA